MTIVNICGCPIDALKASYPRRRMFNIAHLINQEIFMGTRCNYQTNEDTLYLAVFILIGFIRFYRYIVL